MTGERLLENEEATRALGRELAAQAPAGINVLLLGDLGAGKTTFVRGWALGLGIPEAIPSPTFSICNVYEGPHGGLHHFDLYRLDHEEELGAIGLLESLDGPDHCLVEWPELAAGLFRGAVLVLRLSHENGRRFARWHTGPVEGAHSIFQSTE